MGIKTTRPLSDRVDWLEYWRIRASLSSAARESPHAYRSCTSSSERFWASDPRVIFGRGMKGYYVYFDDAATELHVEGESRRMRK